MLARTLARQVRSYEEALENEADEAAGAEVVEGQAGAGTRRSVQTAAAVLVSRM
jgi:hypothetical protein